MAFARFSAKGTERIRRAIVRSGAVAAALLLTSCITFTSQTMTFRYDAAADRLYIFQVYEGIHSEGDETGLTDSEKTELESVVRSERTFFFSNWITEYHRSEIEEAVAELDRKAHRKETEELELAFAKLLVTNVRVRNGAFYLNPRNELSGYQYVTVDNVSQVVRAGNRLIFQPGLSDAFDAESRALVARAVASGFDWVRLDGNRLSFTFPMSDADYLRLRRQMAVDTRKSIESETPDAGAIRRMLSWYVAMAENDFQVAYDANTLTLSLGRSDTASTTAHVRFSRRYRPNAVAHVAAHYREGGTPDIAALIAQLGNPDAGRRDAAAAALAAEGAWAQPQLDAAKDHEDTAIRTQVRAILEAAEAPAPATPEPNALPTDIERRKWTFLRDGRLPD